MGPKVEGALGAVFGGSPGAREVIGEIPPEICVQRCTVAPRSRGDAEILLLLPALLRQPVLNDGGGNATRGRSP